MKTVENNSKSFSPNIFLGILIFLFGFSLYKNISYPLIWNDESFGVMVGERILQYGYPKVHDGKNTVFMSLAENIKDKNGKLVAYQEKYDAFMYETWGSYYWETIGVFLSKFTNDIYQKTALIRIPYATMGLLGLALFLLCAKNIFPDVNRYKNFLILFIFVELFSVSLILHMREARYYSLVIFASACFFYIYSRYFIYKNLSAMKYYIFMTLLLFFTYQVNFTICPILCAVLAFNIAAKFLLTVIKNPRKFKEEFILSIKYSIPILAAAVFIYPFLIFFDTFNTSTVISDYIKFTFETYKSNIGMIYSFLTNLEFAYVFFIVKAVWLILNWYLPVQKNKKDKKNEIFEMMQKFSIFGTSFFMIYALMIARTPTLFIRHYIVLQPIMVLIVSTDIFVVFYQIKMLQKNNIRTTRFAFILLMLISFSLSAKNKIEYLKEHLYEMTQQYKGDLDYVIPYIQQNFKNTDSLVIATNYEEFSYMYYLKSKVTIGYINNNIEDDVKYIPDIILYRKSWGTNPKYFNEFIQKAKYQKVVFPVADYFVNNIPEISSIYVTQHQFKTKLAQNEKEQLEMFVKVK